MIILYFFLMPLLYIPVKIIMFFLVRYYGKFTYDGFNAAGFSYDTYKDIFYSNKNAWQRNFGYSHVYDVASPLFQMIMDTERVKFYYNNKNWLIMFWKGQYGITTGAEIGIYATNQKIVNKKTLYLPIKDREMLDMEFTLYKKNEKITSVSANHWWLAIFKIGMFSRPRNLTMDIKITFPNAEMLNAFLKSFRKLHHNKKNYHIDGNTFYFTFKHPHTRKVWTRFFLSDLIRQGINKKNVKLYNKYLADAFDTDGYLDDEKYIRLANIIPDFLKNPEEKAKKLPISIKDEGNVIFLSDNVYSNLRPKNEQVE